VARRLFRAGRRPALAWLASCCWCARSRPRAAAASTRPTCWAALRGYGELFSLPHTLGIMVLASFTYAAFLALRGLWLGPLLIDRHGFTLVQAGNVALAISVLGMLGPPLFGRFDPGDRTPAPLDRRLHAGLSRRCSRHGGQPQRRLDVAA
jgi:hypothetical protein